MDNLKEQPDASLEFRRAQVKGIGSLDLFIPGKGVDDGLQMDRQAREDNRAFSICHRRQSFREENPCQFRHSSRSQFKALRQRDRSVVHLLHQPHDFRDEGFLDARARRDSDCPFHSFPFAIVYMNRHTSGLRF